MSAVTVPTLSLHAVQRFCERVRPGLDEVNGRRQLEALVANALLAGGQLTDCPPLWATLKADDSYRYLALGDDVLLVVVNGTATTCVTPDRTGDRRRRKAKAKAKASGRPAAPSRRGARRPVEVDDRPWREQRFDRMR